MSSRSNISRKLLCLLGLSALVCIVWFLMEQSAPKNTHGDKSTEGSSQRKTGGSPNRTDSVSAIKNSRMAPHQPSVPAAGEVKVAAAPEFAPPAVVAFRDWAREYFLAEPSERESLIEKGKTLAKAHTIAVAGMIAQDPKGAIQNAVPMVVRQDLPSPIVSLLEERVNQKGELTLWAAVPKEGDSQRQTAYYRTFKPVGGVSSKAYAYGGRVAEHTLSETLVNGIAAAPIEDGPKLVAIADMRVRTLEVGERPDPAKAQSNTCPVSGKTTVLDESVAAVSEQTPAFEDEDTVHFVCFGGHVGVYNTSLYTEETKAHWATLTQRSETAALDDNIAYEGATGGPITPVTVPSSWTTGVRKVLFIRVTFSDHYQDPQSESEAYELMRQVSDEITAMSYGRTYFQATVTPLLVLNRTNAWLSKYEDDGGDAAGLLYADARELAKAAGYDTDFYDLDVVRWNGSVGDFGGAASVGGKYFADKVGTKSVSLHEFGHNLGLLHSNAWKSNPPSIYGPGYSFEYANYWDWLGASGEGGHFVAPSKAQLNWLPREGQALAQKSGTYRIHQTDQPLFDPAKRYALRVKKDAERDYWFEFRPTHPTNIGIQNGLMTTFNSWGSGAGGDISTGTSNGPVFLDMTPGSWRPTVTDTRQDGMLVIGRTFTDTETNMSVTPVAKNATTPPSIDVTVNLGPFPGNNAPTQTLTPSATTAATGVSINFTSAATDPDGDTLAYAWDFGDGTFSTNNSSTQSKSWSTAGHYVVRCTVSDMKGKVHTAKVLITVGSPTTYTISGTVTGPGAVPLEGVQVANQIIDLTSNTYFTNNGFVHPSAASYRSGYTDSNGHYIITGVAAGSNTLYANLYPYSFTVGFTNPVSVAANVTGANWTAVDIPALSITALDAAAAETGDTGTFRITRSGSTTASLQVQLLDATGSATLTSDYTLSPALAVNNNANFLTIPAGSSTLDVTLTPVNDSNSEGVENATMTLANVVLGYRVSGSNQATVQITDDESALSVVSLTSVETWAAEPSDGASLLVTRTGSTAAALTVNLTYAGTALVGSDFSATSSVTIPIGQSSVALPISALDDSESEGTETLTVIIRTDAAYQIASDAKLVTFDLNDDDIQTVDIAATDASATEAGDPGLFTITRSGTDLSKSLIVDYSINGTALHGKDYARLEGRATIAAGESNTTIRISPYNDTIGEGNQTVTIILRSDGRYLVGSPQTATVTIADDDQPTLYLRTMLTERLEPASVTLVGNVFRIQRQSSGTALTVNYTVSGTATSSSDFTALSGTVSFALGDLSKDISLSVLADANLEDSETVNLTLAAGTGYQIAPFDNTATTVIVDADKPQVAVSATDPTSTPPALAESATQMRFYISRDSNPASALIVNYTMSGTATSVSDYTGATGSVTIPASAYGAYVTLTPVDDSTAEGTESVTLNITTDVAYGLRTSSATVFLLDNDTFAGGSPTVSFNTSTSTATESAGTLNIPVTLTGTPGAPVTVRYAISGGSADLSDAGLAAGTLTFAAAGTQNLPLLIKTDSFPESSETVEVTLSNAYGAAIGTAVHVVTITDLAQPEAFTRSPSNVLATTAVMNGAAIPHGVTATAYFQWGTTTAYGNTTSSQAIGSGQAEVAVTQAISGLTAGQTYHYRMVATNASGTSYGNNYLIVTSASPVVQTLAANNRTSNSARLNATVNPNGLTTQVWFEWGATSSYGNTTSTQSLGSGGSSVSAYAAITGLTAGSTYHFRAVASNASGTTYGANQIFVPSSLAVAGTLYVNVRASNATAGAATWGSSGTLADFVEVGAPTLVSDINSSGISGVQFDGTTTAYNGPTSVADIQEASDRTIEVWYFNPAGEVQQEALVTMGHQGHTRSLLGLSAGNYYATHFWTETIAWNSVPSYGEWHHLVMVYDGATSVTYYVDGLEKMSKNLSAALDTWSRPIILGASTNISDVINWGNYGFSGYLNTVRIHGGKLSANQVLNNYQYGPSISDAPEAFTRAATTVIDDRFTAKGKVEPNGLATTAWIEYGPTTSYGYQSSVTVIGASSAPTDISNVVFGISGVTYNYRVVAQNAAGIVYGENMTATLNSLVSAGTLHVDIKATQAGAGTTTWPNLGALGGNFTAIATPVYTSNVLSTNVPGVQFNGTDNGYYGPTSPADVTGQSDRTIEVWMYNPAVSGVEMMVDLSRYDGTVRGTYNAACSGTMHYLSGGDVNWAGGAPAVGAWHHLVYVYDGNTNVKGYVDGVLTTNTTIAGVLVTTAAQISMGSLRNGTGNTSFQWTSFGYSGYLNTVRVHGGQLNASQVAQNYAAGPAVPLAPAVYTSATDGVTTTAAALHGSANPKSLATSAWFEYGPTTAYGTSTSVQSLGSGSTAVVVNQALTGLTPNMLYHCRLVAQNSAGTSYGSDVTFTTNAAGLTTLVLSSGTLSPVFATTTLDYTATVPNATSSITMTPTVNTAGSTVTVNGNTVTSGSPSSAIALAVGSNSIPVVVSNNGTRTYTVVVTRQSSFDAFMISSGASGGNLGVGQDYDGDGVANLHEYAFGMSAVVKDLAGLVLSGSTIVSRGMPVLFKDNQVPAVYHARFVRRKDYVTAGISYAVMFSNDLVTWEASAASLTVVASDASYDVIDVPYPSLVGGQIPRFFRIAVSNSP